MRAFRQRCRASCRAIPAATAVDAHAIQPFYAGLLARECGLAITLAPEGEAIVLTAA